MKTPPVLALFAAAFVAATPFVAWANEDDDTLKFFLSKSELVVSGVITTEPNGISDEMGVLDYSCEYKVQDVLKGDATLKGKVIKVSIMRFEAGSKDEHPLLKKNQECILFLKSASPNTPSWVTADYWFGVQQQSSWMVKSLQRLAAEKAEPQQPALSKSQPGAPKHEPNSGYVPDAAAATDIAKVVLSRLLSPSELAHKEIFDATLKEGIWTVLCSEPKLRLSSPITVQIRQNTGAIIKYEDRNV
jgi:hypothetical protein